ncbi:YafY family transcriptional regulator [Phormidium tenue FACHB-886]|nr:YafY family transcriptional regulator [Phormidium tenue FACHB-886]
MYQPTSRVLTVLELLQSHVQISGAELAERLEVDRRTVRRYILQLQELGIPIEAERGRYGTYRLCPGYKLPPLMFSENEAIALTVGLLTAQKLRLESGTLAVEGTLAKVLRVLPHELRDRVQAVQKTLVVETVSSQSKAVAHGVVATLGLAIEQGRQVQLGYQTHSGALSERIIDAYGLVYRIYWYVVGYCHLRKDLRTFRLDRILTLELLDHTFPQPNAFDPLQFVEQSIANTPRQYRAKVLLKTTLEEAQARVPTAIATLSALDKGVLLTCYGDSLAWLSQFLLELRLPLVIYEPSELREEMQRLQTQIAQMLLGEERSSDLSSSSGCR